MLVEPKVYNAGVRASKLYVGWKSNIVRQDLIPAVHAPQNYKDPVKIAEYIKAVKPAKDEEFAILPGPASLTEIVVLDKDGTGPIFRARGAGIAAVKFHEFLVANQANWSLNNHDYPAWIRARGAQRLFQLMAYDLLTWPTPPVAVYPKLTIWNYLKPLHDLDDVKLFVNPLSFFAPGAESPEHALRCVNATWFKDEEPIEVGDPMSDAMTAYRICCKLSI